MKTKLIIDNRETQLKSLFQENHNVEHSNLIHGDIMMLYGDGEAINTVFAVFERKTIADLVSSIKDGRYRNQKLELLSSYNRSQIYYIIEGFDGFNEDNNLNINGLSKAHINGAILNTLCRDDIKVMFTKDINDTYNFIVNLFARFQKETDKYITKHSPCEKQIITKKSSSLSKETFLKYVLCQVPGISEKIASELTKRFGNMKAFYQELSSKESDEDKVILLCESKIASRAIPKTALKNIVMFMF